VYCSSVPVSVSVESQTLYISTSQQLYTQHSVMRDSEMQGGGFT
jgi:hypothetical protein